MASSLEAISKPHLVCRHCTWENRISFSSVTIDNGWTVLWSPPSYSQDLDLGLQSENNFEESRIGVERIPARARVLDQFFQISNNLSDVSLPNVKGPRDTVYVPIMLVQNVVEDSLPVS